MATPTIAANAYANLARVLENTGAGKGSEPNGQSFAALLKDAVGSVMESGRKSDAQTVAMANGNVKYPNVNPVIEMTDMREAQRSYEANLNIISATRRMIQRTLDILKA